MNPLVNRTWNHPQDGWYMLEAAGEHPHHSGVVQVVDGAAVRAICDRFAAEARRPGFAGMLVDIEHFKLDPERETRAYGWLKELQARPEGIFGRIDWTETGRRAVDGGDYRFFSTEYERDECQDLGGGRIRPLRLAGLTLTNDPNNKGQIPITNRLGRTAELDGEELDSGIFVPLVANRFAGADEAAEVSRQAERLAKLHLVLANREQVLCGIGFDQAWREVENDPAYMLANRKSFESCEQTLEDFYEMLRTRRLKSRNWFEVLYDTRMAGIGVDAAFKALCEMDDKVDPAGEAACDEMMRQIEYKRSKGAGWCEAFLGVSPNVWAQHVAYSQSTGAPILLRGGWY